MVLASCSDSPGAPRHRMRRRQSTRQVRGIRVKSGSTTTPRLSRPRWAKRRTRPKTAEPATRDRPGTRVAEQAARSARARAAPEPSRATLGAGRPRRALRPATRSRNAPRCRTPLLRAAHRTPASLLPATLGWADCNGVASDGAHVHRAVWRDRVGVRRFDVCLPMSMAFHDRLQRRMCGHERRLGQLRHVRACLRRGRDLRRPGGPASTRVRSSRRPA